MKRLMIFTISLLIFIFGSVYAVSVLNCRSYGDSNWDCEKDETCVCEIVGDCTDGDLLVYRHDITNLLCAPEISGSSVSILWENCGNPLGDVQVRADCEEDQSAQRNIRIYDVSGGSGVTTTSTTTTTTIMEVCNYVCQSTCMNDNNSPFCYRRTSHGVSGCPGGTICCESTFIDCSTASTPEPVRTYKTCPYDCCIDDPAYEYKPCDSGLKCCDRLCKESCQETISIKAPSSKLMFWILLAIGIPIIAFVIFALKREKLGKMPEF